MLIHQEHNSILTKPLRVRNNVVCKMYTNDRISDNLESNKWVVISGWLIRFSDFQGHVAFGSKLADTVEKESRLVEPLYILSAGVLPYMGHYRYVRPQRVCFFSRFGHKWGIEFWPVLS